jgi:hypothetical protein
MRTSTRSDEGAGASNIMLKTAARIIFDLDRITELELVANRIVARKTGETCRSASNDIMAECRLLTAMHRVL